MKFKISFFICLLFLISFVSSVSLEENVQLKPSSTNTTFIIGNTSNFSSVEVYSNYLKLDNNTIEVTSSLGNASIYFYNFTDDYKKFNETKTNSSATVDYTIGNFTSGVSVLITKDNVAWQAKTANSSGQISFNYSGDSAMFEIELGSMPSSLSSSSSSSSSSGGGLLSAIPFWKMSYIVSNEDFQNGYGRQIGAKERFRFKVGNKTEYHHVGVLEINNNSIKIEVASEPQEATLLVGDERRFDVDKDNYYDVYVKLNSINETRADLTIKEIHEEITEETQVEEQQKEDNAVDDTIKNPTQESSNWIYVLIGLVVLIIVIVGILKYRRKSK